MGGQRVEFHEVPLSFFFFFYATENSRCFRSQAALGSRNCWRRPIGSGDGGGVGCGRWRDSGRLALRTILPLRPMSDWRGVDWTYLWTAAADVDGTSLLSIAIARFGSERESAPAESAPAGGRAGARRGGLGGFVSCLHRDRDPLSAPARRGHKLLGHFPYGILLIAPTCLPRIRCLFYLYAVCFFSCSLLCFEMLRTDER